MKEGVLVSYDCCNNMPWTLWLKTMEIDSLTDLETKSPNSASLGQNQGVFRAVLPPKALGENLFPACSSFWWLLASCFVSTSLQSQPLSSYCYLLSVSASLIRILVIALGPTWVIQDTLRISKSLIVSAKILFPNEAILQVPRIRIWYLGEGCEVDLRLNAYHKHLALKTSWV